VNKILIIISIGFITSCANIAPSKSNSEKEIYKNWVLSRCLSFIANDDIQKQDALNTASAFLELSSLPVEDFLKSEKLTKKYISLTYQGSISGTFKTKKCIDLFNSNELNELKDGCIIHTRRSKGKITVGHRFAIISNGHLPLSKALYF